MPIFDSSSNEQIQQIKGIIADYIGSRPTVGTVSSVGNGTVDVAMGLNSTSLKGISVIGGTNGMVTGDTTYILYFSNQAVAINTRSFVGGKSAQGQSPHDHNTLYYSKAIVDNKLAGKSDVTHTHSPKIIKADSGLIGGWNIDSTGIYENHTRLSSLGYISFGNTPSTGWGYNPGWGTGYGVWVGWDYGITDSGHALTPVFANDPEGKATVAGPKMAFYQDANNYLLWTGAKLLVKAANFTLDGGGNVTASNVNLTGSINAISGTIGNWSIVSSKLQSKSGSIVLDGTAETIAIGTGLLLDGANKNIRTTGFVSGVTGFKLDGITGNAEFNNISARGEFHASVFIIDEQHAVGGSQIILPAAALYQDAVTV